MSYIASFTRGDLFYIPLGNPIISLLTLFTLFVPSQSQTKCFLPNGTHDPTNGWAAPCSSDLSNPLHSICCQLRFSNPPGGDRSVGSTRDECLPNGLCQNRYLSSKDGNVTEYYRQTCTSDNWNTGACLNVCSEGELGGVAARMTPCDGTNTSETWCCGANKDCCGSSEAIKIPRLFARAENSTTASSSSKSSSISSSATSTIIVSSGLPTQPLASPTNSAAASTTSKTELGREEIIGIVVGSIAGLGSLIGLAIFVAKRRRASKHVQVQGMGGDSNSRELDTSDSTRHELGPGSTPSVAAVELAGSNHTLPGVPADQSSLRH